MNSSPLSPTFVRHYSMKKYKYKWKNKSLVEMPYVIPLFEFYLI